MKTKVFVVIVFFFVLPVITACSSLMTQTPTANLPAISGSPGALETPATPAGSAGVEQLQGVWELVWWDHQLSVPQEPITLIIEGSDVVGQMDCNRYHIPNAVTSTEFRPEAMTITFALCNEAGEEIEATYQKLLSEIDTWKRAEDSLALSTKGTETLRYRVQK
ncbi:MAG: META domain-containing protein [Propionibacteriaceae bacterium]|nr:META domain-containing protein [Propionibacteriaceae bacterium]